MTKSKKKNYIKVIDEQFIVPYEKGEGIIKFEAWEYENQIIKYNMVYINKSVFPNDNGRAIGYDNSHNFHHKHYFGQITELDDFTNYQELVQRFKNDIKEFIKW
ncbi:MAG: transcriptional regulator [Epsilonproteobacteria bacterium]|nr:MAG: transcriptional regulator [Campylobacterota bacterium]